jgi:hypothetical protein
MEIFDKRPAHGGSDSVRNYVRCVHYQKRQVSHADSGIKRGRICHPMGSAGDLGCALSAAAGFQPISHFWNWSSRAPAAARTTPCHTKTSRHRLAEAARLERLEAERERQGDSHFGKTTENRIVCGELIELELQEIDEQVSRICSAAGRGPRAPIRSNLRAGGLMNATTHEPLNLNSEELAVLAALLSRNGPSC